MSEIHMVLNLFDEGDTFLPTCVDSLEFLTVNLEWWVFRALFEEKGES
ncbi:Oocyte maturation, beta [Apodemus speciosus]|uniref:Oocyte maturation, beta n=1 Tax=Apodemus speciosus TaxID=105296 RepID=A0ABQ0F5B3_APOSI